MIDLKKYYLKPNIIYLPMFFSNLVSLNSWHLNALNLTDWIYQKSVYPAAIDIIQALYQLFFLKCLVCEFLLCFSISKKLGLGLDRSWQQKMGFASYLMIFQRRACLFLAKNLPKNEENYCVPTCVVYNPKFLKIGFCR